MYVRFDKSVTANAVTLFFLIASRQFLYLSINKYKNIIILIISYSR